MAYSETIESRRGEVLKGAQITEVLKAHGLGIQGFASFLDDIGGLEEYNEGGILWEELMGWLGY